MTERSITDFGAGFHDRLATYWPHPREQLHHGGWETTHWLFDYLNLVPEMTLLDYCCGEGGTSHWAAANYPVIVYGLDIVERAIHTAHAAQDASTSSPHFIVADGFEIPLSDTSVDIIFGQDPDAFGYHTRAEAFAECYRVLRPGGQMVFHHYAIHDSAPEPVKERFNSINAELGFGAFGRLTAAEYLSDLQSVGFIIEKTTDMTAIYRDHMSQMRALATARGETLDKWTNWVLDIMIAGVEVGMFFDVRKPYA